jgi:hypothetical protein
MPIFLRVPPQQCAVPHASINTHRCCGREDVHELSSIESMPSDDASLVIRDDDFEHGLCDVHGECRSIHLGLLLVSLMGISGYGIMPHPNREDSIPSR